jgi:uncharacterized membrane protein
MDGRQWLAHGRILAGLAWLIAATAATAADIDGFTPIDPLPGVLPEFDILLYDMTPDGHIAVGSDRYSPRAVRWVEGEIEYLTFSPFPSDFARAFDITDDGSVIVGGTDRAYYPNALVWRDGQLSILPRPDLPQPYAVANAVSEDGRIIIGAAAHLPPIPSGRRASRWVDGAIEVLLEPGAPAFSSADLISRDGRIVVGSAWYSSPGERAVRWVDGVPEFMVDPMDGFRFKAVDMTPDGRVIVGYSYGGPVAEAVRWVDGQFEPLFEPPVGISFSRAFAVTDDATMIFGQMWRTPLEDCYEESTCQIPYGPFVWTEASGALPLLEWLRFGCGYDIANWAIGFRQISGDGTRLAVHSHSSGQFERRNDLVEIGDCAFDYEVPDWTTGPGDYYFADYNLGAIFRMHGETGETQLLTARGEIRYPLDLEIAADGSIYILSSGRIIRFDPETAVQSVVASLDLLTNPTHIAQGADGTLFALNIANYRNPEATIVSIDPETGSQAIVSSGGWLDYNPGIATRSNGNLLSIGREDDLWWVIEIDRVTGVQTALTEIDVPAGSTLGTLAYDAQSDQLLLRGPTSEILSVDLEFGTTTAWTDVPVVGTDIESASGGAAIAIAHKTIWRATPSGGDPEIVQAWGQLDKPWAIQQVRAACDDGLDNDSDGLVDRADPGCRDLTDDSEIHRSDVRIAIEPRRHRARVFLRPNRRVRVAILGADTLNIRHTVFDELAFGPAGATPLRPFQRARLDVNRDGHRDLGVRFRTAETGLAPGDTEACLMGTADGLPFRACDAIEVVGWPGCGHGFDQALLLPVFVALSRVRRRIGSKRGRAGP